MKLGQVYADGWSVVAALLLEVSHTIPSKAKDEQHRKKIEAIPIPHYRSETNCIPTANFYRNHLRLQSIILQIQRPYVHGWPSLIGRK